MNKIKFGPRAGSRKLLWGIVLGAIAIDLTSIVLRRMQHGSDFDISMVFGQRFIAGEYLYRGGLHFPYMPAAAMWFSLFACFPSPVAFGLSYCLALASLGLVMRMLRRMVSEETPAVIARSYYVEVITLILTAHFVVRDLDDGGPNIILLAIVVAGIYFIFEQRQVLGPLCLGLATALKATNGIFVPFLLWKRQWLLAFYTAAFALLWISLPILRMGPASWWMHQREWFSSAMGFALAHNSAAEYYYGYRNVHNQAFRPAIQVYLATQTPGAGVSIKLVSGFAALLLVGVFCRATRRPYGSKLSIDWLTDSSGLMIMAVMLAPLAWAQHFVVAVPAIYLITAGWFSGRRLGALGSTAIVLYVVAVFGLSRPLLGKVRYEVVLGYHILTFAMLLILAVLLSTRALESTTPFEERVWEPLRSHH